MCVPDFCLLLIFLTWEISMIRAFLVFFPRKPEKKGQKLCGNNGPTPVRDEDAPPITINRTV